MLELAGVSHRYAEQLALDCVSLELAPGRIGCILGPSGCGKTTLLRCVAGFERISAGRISAAGTILTSETIHIAPERRRIGMVFQDYALLPHLTARQNVVFALHGRPKRDARSTALKFLKLVGLEELADRYPHQLSGGQQQRVALARALAPEPRLLLMDEPFSNLDAGLRQDLGQEIRQLLLQLGTTALTAMHDHHDAFSIADDVGVLRAGRMLQWDSAYELYHRPADRFVADFVGKGVWIEGRVRDKDSVDTELGHICGHMEEILPAGTVVDILLRPDDVVHDDDSTMTAMVISRQFRGSEFLYELQTASGAKLLSSVPSHHKHPVGEAIGIRLQTDHIVMFARS